MVLREDIKSLQIARDTLTRLLKDPQFNPEAASVRVELDRFILYVKACAYDSMMADDQRPAEGE